MPQTVPSDNERGPLAVAGGGVNMPSEQGIFTALYADSSRPSFVMVFSALLRKNCALSWRLWRVMSLLRSFVVYGGCLLGTYLLVKKGTQDPQHEVQSRMVIQLVMLLIAPLFLSSAQILALQNLVAEMVTDKESKMKIVQLVNGVPLWLYWASYLTYYLTVSLVMSIGFTVILIETCMTRSSPILVCIVLQLSYTQVFAFGAAMVTIFGRARRAASACALLTLLGFIQPVLGAMTFSGGISSLPKWVYFLLGFLPTCTLGSLMQSILNLEMGGVDSAFNPIPPQGWSFGRTFFLQPARPFQEPGDDRGGWNLQPSAGESFLALIAQTMAWIAFAYWFDQIWQSEFGAAKPKLFCFMPAYMCPKRNAQSDAGLAAGDEESQVTSAVEIKSLSKVFTRNGEQFAAVDNMSLDVNRGEIFALLGHNGAGKTTLMNCIVGMMPVTSGDAFILGHSVVTDSEQARWKLAICPQDNPLYEKLTLEEHLRLFATLRGSPHVDTEVHDVLQALGLADKRLARCSDLSGGQKRRLWVATSLLGVAPVVFLDEPTSGMDPASRRELWDLLLSMKARGRTVIFTTHYLDEADLLADRKAVLAHGRVEAVGTSRELKAQYGVGYHLRILISSTDRTSTSTALRSMVEHLVPAATMEEITEEESAQASDAPAVVSFALPFSSIDAFGPLLNELEARKSELQVTDYELAMTSLEEVFLKIGRLEQETLPEGGDQPLVDIQAEDPGTFTWSRAEVSWLAATSLVFSLRLREVLANKRVLIRTLIMPLLILLWFFSMTSNFNFGGSAHGEAMDTGSGGLFPGMAVGVAVTSCVVTLVRERLSKAKHVMLSQGLPVSAYWSGTLLQNYVQVLVVSLAVPVISLATNQSYITDSRALLTFVAAILYPLPVILFGYLISCQYLTSEGVMKTIPLLGTLLGGIPAMVASTMLHASQFGSPTVLGIALKIHAAASLLSPYYCLPGTMIGLWWSRSAANQHSMSGDSGALSYLGMWEISLPIAGGCMMTVLLALGLLRWDSSRDSRQEAWDRGDHRRLDEDVVAEEVRASTVDPEHDAVLYRGLAHTYKSGNRTTQAVRGISLGIQSGECFGLLGPNGAGKTTTLGCLTGEICPPSEGEVFLAGHPVTRPGTSDAFKHLGFCPQVDPLFPQLSGREHLVFYGRLKGVPGDAVYSEADRVLRRLGFSVMDSLKPAETYSGGMQRKLSLGIALIGGSKILLLDEPSAAVDAGAKRHLWRVIKQRAPDQTVVVTTHSMEEAEALCDRLAIQVLGQLRCIGTPLHIKAKYGSGYQLEICLNRPCADAESRISSFVRASITDRATLLESHSGRYVFQLPPMQQTGLTLGHVFTALHAARQEHGIADYSLAQPSLEQVFLRFAQEQEQGIEAPSLQLEQPATAPITALGVASTPGALVQDLSTPLSRGSASP
mmetsp:Transcript_40510/g.107011  ORF Transcript_40510/g.107011 Transcript_40510/m.107011 type:complete len:1425 (-) Transcript_40510:131-4405(-)